MKVSQILVRKYEFTFMKQVSIPWKDIPANVSSINYDSCGEAHAPTNFIDDKYGKN